MLLAIDIGNTNIVFGLLEDTRILKDWRLRSDPGLTADEIGVFLGSLFARAGIAPEGVAAGIVTSTVPSLVPTVERFCRAYLGWAPAVVGPDLDVGMPSRYADPRELGPDRIVNAVGAYARYRRALIVVDFGTATTFDCVSPDGVYLGGIIAPGLTLGAEALHARAARLPRIQNFSPPERVIGINTVDSMRAGIVTGYAGLVEGLVTRIRAEMGTPAIVIATGGLAHVMGQVTDVIAHIEPHLTLEGLGVIAARLKLGPRPKVLD